jgi:hypothetical protein
MIQLEFVRSVEDIRTSIGNFVSNNAGNPDVTKGLIAGTFWVYDPAMESFGPSKFVGFRNMNFHHYEIARSGGSEGARFDGHATRMAIERVLSRSYLPDTKLAEALKFWAASAVPDQANILAGVDTSKWQFISLPTGHQAQQWTEEEIGYTVAAYMDMLQKELAGEPFSKTEYRNSLLKQLKNSRNAAAIEFKHANISAILHGMGRPYIDGYKPRGNYQSALKKAIEEYLVTKSDMAQALEGALDSPVDTPPDGARVRIADIEEEPPVGTPGIGRIHNARRMPNKTDWAAVDAINRKLGVQGEKFAFDIEVAHLREIGRDDLAERVEWVARIQGDGLGYDIRSYDDLGREKFIEVKTTRGPKSMPFLFTANELDCANELRGQYWIYRLFRFGSGTRLYRTSGSIGDHFIVRPKVFVAVAK